MLKLTQPQRRASYPDTHEGDQLRKSSASSKHRAPQRTPPKHESERAAACVDAKADAAAAASVIPRHRRASSAILRRPSMRARASASVTPTKGRSAGCLSLQGRSAAHELGIERQPAILSSSRLALQNGSLAATVKPRWEKVQFGSCIACKPVLYRYHSVPELEISTFFP